MLRLDTLFRPVQRVWFTPDGRTVAAQTLSNSYLRWDLSEPGWRHEINGPGDGSNGAASADLSMTAETEYHRFQVTAVVLRCGPEPVWRADGLSYHQLPLEFSADGSRLWSCGVTYEPQHFTVSVMAWDTADGRRVLHLEAPVALDWVLPAPDNRRAVGRPGHANEL